MAQCNTYIYDNTKPTKIVAQHIPTGPIESTAQSHIASGG